MSIKKIGSCKNLWPKRHLLGFENIFNNVSFQRKSFVYQFALAFLQTKGMGFFSQGLGRAGGGYKDTPGCLDTDSPILACSRLSDRGEGAKRYEQKKN